MFQKPVALANPSDDDKKSLVASINSLTINLELIDKIILKQLANQNQASYRLIKGAQK